MAYRASPRSGIQVVRDAPSVRRHTRTPEHTFFVRHYPWQIQPFFIAPVVPGETMKNMLMNARARSNVALSSPLTGWWHEVYFFYVKHRDLPNAADAMALHLDAEASINNLDTLADPAVGHFVVGANQRLNWTRQCLDAVVNEYFRDEDETSADHTLFTLPLAQLHMTGLMQSAVLDLVGGTALGDYALPGEEEYDAVKYANVPSEFQSMYRAWSDMKDMRLTTGTFEDYLKSFGVRPPKELRVEEIAKPELLRYIRQWKYPDVSMQDTGLSGYQFRLDIQERADKDRFFAEPGFLFGVTVVRPKVYAAEQAMSGVTILDDAYGWLPAVLREEAYTSLVKFDVSTEGGSPDGIHIVPEPTTDSDYWVDRKDLFVHGDQFTNVPIDSRAGAPFVNALDPADYRLRYVTDTTAAVNGLFTTELIDSEGVPVEFSLPPFEMDGIVRPSILSRIEDTSL